MLYFILIINLIVSIGISDCKFGVDQSSRDDKPGLYRDKYEFDPNGYVLFCLCMGRFGNQADHFLGSMSFAMKLNRTLVVPPFITNKNVPFRKWFKLEKLAEYHKIIPAEDFMKYIAPTYWPEGKRISFCWMPSHMKNIVKECEMKRGNPMENFWNELGVNNFDESRIFDFSYDEHEKWIENYPASEYPVIALKGAPASYPILKENRINQKYLEWSDEIKNEADDFIDRVFNNEKFVGIHLRNGPDWENACSKINGLNSYMSSPQCLENTNRKVTLKICYPNNTVILKKLENVLIKKLNGTVKNIYVATDKNPMIHDIEEHFKDKLSGLNIVHNDPWLPVVDLAILERSEHFIGNCISSFTSFVKRKRDILGEPSSFWGIKSPAACSDDKNQ